MAKYIIASTRLNDDGTIHAVSHPIEVDSDTVNTIKIFDKTYVKQEHGHWEDVEPTLFRDRFATCSVCRVRQLLDKDSFCPNCGAKMDGMEGRMTKEEAIRRLEEGAPFSELYDETWEKALEMAIEALRDKLETEKRQSNW